MSEAALLLFAAGASRRMEGRDKLLEEVDGAPLIRRQALAALETGAWVGVLLPPDRPERAAALEGLALSQVVVARAAEGMGASFRAGMEALPPGTPACVMMLADMPEITGADVSRLIDAWRRDPARAHRLTGPRDEPGQPVIFPSRLFPALARLEGDTGGRDVLRREAVGLVPCPDERALVDLDTPEDWARWRARRGSL